MQCVHDCRVHIDGTVGVPPLTRSSVTSSHLLPVYPIHAMQANGRRTHTCIDVQYVMSSCRLQWPTPIRAIWCLFVHLFSPACYSSLLCIGLHRSIPAVGLISSIDQTRAAATTYFILTIFVAVNIDRSAPSTVANFRIICRFICIDIMLCSMQRGAMSSVPSLSGCAIFEPSLFASALQKAMQLCLLQTALSFLFLLFSFVMIQTVHSLALPHLIFK
jgi:hypothetical protein